MDMTHSWYKREGNTIHTSPSSYSYTYKHLYIHISYKNVSIYSFSGNNLVHGNLSCEYMLYQPLYVFIKKLLFLFYNGCEAGCVSYCCIKIWMSYIYLTSTWLILFNASYGFWYCKPPKKSKLYIHLIPVLVL